MNACLCLGDKTRVFLSAKRISILSIDKAGALKQLLVFEIFVIRSIGEGGRQEYAAFDMQRAVVYGVARVTERVGNESGRDDQ